jgi:hypothetical protein
MFTSAYCRQRLGLLDEPVASAKAGPGADPQAYAFHITWFSHHDNGFKKCEF